MSTQPIQVVLISQIVKVFMLIKFIAFLLLLCFIIESNDSTKLELVLQLKHSEYVSSSKCTPDGKVIISGSSDCIINMWDSKSGKLLRSINDHLGNVNCIDISRDGKKIGSGSDDSTLRIYDTKTGKIKKELIGHKGPVLSLSFSNDGNLIVSGGADNRVILWDLITGEQLKVFNKHSTPVRLVTFSNDNRKIVSSGEDSTVTFWDVESGTIIKEFRDLPCNINLLSFSPNNKKIVVGINSEIMLWNNTFNYNWIGNENYLTVTPFLLEYSLHHNKVTALSYGSSLAYSYGKKDFLIASASFGRITVSYDNEYNKTSIKYNTDSMYINNVSFVNYNNIFGGGREKARIWTSSKTFNEVNYYEQRKRSNYVAISEDHLLTHINKEFIVWDSRTALPLFNIHSGLDYIDKISFSSKERLIAVAQKELIYIYDYETGKIVKKIAGNPPFTIRNLSFSPNGKLLLTSDKNSGAITIWDYNKGWIIRRIGEDSENLKNVVHCFSPCGRYVVVSGDSRKVKIWDVNSAKLIKTSKILYRDVKKLSFLKNGNLLITSRNHVLELDIENDNIVNTFKSNLGVFSTIAISDDEELIAVSGNDFLTVWSKRTGQVKAEFKIPRDIVSSLFFTINNNVLMTIGRNGIIKYWNLNTKELILTSYLQEKRQFISYTPDGYYNCSKDIENLISWRIGDKIYENRDYSKKYFNSDKIDSCLNLKKILAKGTNENLLSVIWKNEFKNTSEKMNELIFEYFGNHAIKKINAKLNDESIKVDVSNDNQSLIKIPLTLVDYNNKFEINLIFDSTSESANFLTYFTYSNGIKVNNEISNSLEPLISLKLDKHMSEIKNVKFDGIETSKMDLEIIGNDLSVRGEKKWFEKLRDGYHEVTAFIGGKYKKIKLYKENGELLKYKNKNMGKSFAILIGISKYHTREFDDLIEVENDCRELGKVLENNNFDVTYLLDTEMNVNYENLNATIFKINKKMNPLKDQLFFYYGGHGKAIKPPFGDSTAYLILNDYDLSNIENTCLSMDDIVRGKYTKNINAKHALYAIDACVAGLDLRNTYTDTSQLRKFKDLSLIYSITEKPSRTILTAGTGGQLVINDRGAGGIFTLALIKALKGEADLKYGDGNAILMMNELDTYVKTEVSADAFLQNWKQLPRRLDFGEGQFIFILNPNSFKEDTEKCLD